MAVTNYYRTLIYLILKSKTVAVSDMGSVPTLTGRFDKSNLEVKCLQYLPEYSNKSPSVNRLSEPSKQARCFTLRLWCARTIHNSHLLAKLPTKASRAAAVLGATASDPMVIYIAAPGNDPTQMVLVLDTIFPLGR